MWSLPDIKRLNSEAQSNRNKFKRAVRTGTLDRKKLQCEWRDHDEPAKCSGDLHHYSVYDIFSDDPKGVLTLCEHHDGYYGSPSEGYFECIDCNRVTTENYTWELYYHDTEDGQLCLPCYADRELAEPSNWIPLTDAVIDTLTFQDVRKAKHLIGVQMPIPKGIKFLGNTEMDGSSGGRLTAFSSCEDSPDGAVEELKETLHRAQDEGHKRAILILDAAYQFSISIGIYVPIHEPGESILRGAQADRLEIR